MGTRDTEIRLLVDNKVVRTAAGKYNEKLEPAHWDVREFVGRSAHIEIVDEQAGGWGHINVDQIEFSDLPGSTAALEVVEDLLPIRLKGIKSGAGRMEFEDLDASARREAVGTEALRRSPRPAEPPKSDWAAKWP